MLALLQHTRQNTCQPHPQERSSLLSGVHTWPSCVHTHDLHTLFSHLSSWKSTLMSEFFFPQTWFFQHPSACCCKKVWPKQMVKELQVFSATYLHPVTGCDNGISQNIINSAPNPQTPFLKKFISVQEKKRKHKTKPEGERQSWNEFDCRSLCSCRHSTY